MTISNEIITMERLELLNLLSDAIAIGAKKAMIDTMAIKPYITKSEAYKMYGRRKVDRWLKEGLVKPIKDGDSNYSIRIDRLKIDAVASVSNRVSFYKHKYEEELCG